MFSLLGLLGFWGILLGLSYVLFHVVTTRKKIRHVETRAVLPGPEPVYPVGIPVSIIHGFDKSHKLCQELFDKYGDNFQLCFGPLKEFGWFTCDVQVIQHMRERSKYYLLRQYPDLFDSYLKNKGILFTNDLAHWKIHRNIALQGMMKQSHLRKIAHWTVESTCQLLLNWQNTFGKSSETFSFVSEIDHYMMRLGLSVIAKAAFSVQIDEPQEISSEAKDKVNHDTSDLETMVRKIMEGTNKFNHFPPWVWKIYKTESFKKSHNATLELQQFIRDIIQKRKKEGVGKYNDLLDILLGGSTSEDRQSHQVGDDETVMITCQDLFLAGHETTSHTLAWSCYLLAKNPAVQETLQMEVDECLFQDDKMPSYDILNSLLYTAKVVKETLRLYPTVPLIPKKSVEDEVLLGYFTRKETPIFISSFQLHRNPKYWPNPDTFDPLRWKNVNETESTPNLSESLNNLEYPSNAKAQAQAYIPFGLAPRNCIGNRMALMEARLVLAILMYFFSVETVPGVSDADQVDGISNVTLRPENLVLKFSSRKPIPRTLLQQYIQQQSSVASSNTVTPTVDTNYKHE